MAKKKIFILLALLFGFFLYTGSFVFSYGKIFKNKDPKVVMDVGRLNSNKVNRIEKPQTVDDLKKIMLEAKKKDLKVAISGSRHSQGGQSYYQDAIMLDMSSLNKVLNLDVQNKILQVQSGAKWKDVQQYINPHGLAVKVMQSSYIFTIGGTLSANAHGRDLDMSCFVETVRSFHLMTADGEVLNVSRSENPELFKLVIGGYGLFGVILDVEIQLTDNEIFEQNSVVMNYKEFPDYFEKNIRNNPDVKMMLVRPSIAKDTFLQELVVATWNKTDKTKDGIYELTEEDNVLRDKFFFSLSRKFDWAKDLRWMLQKKIETGVGEKRIMSRTNAMRPPLAPLEFLDYYSTKDTDILQEYFIPVSQFVPFMDEFREILKANKINVISFTIRFVKANDDIYMAYAPQEDSFAIIYMANVRLSKEAQAKVEAVTQKIVDAALRNRGTYYLTYQLYPTKEQLRKAYPNTDLFFSKKREYDPNERFMNKFYEKYVK